MKRMVLIFATLLSVWGCSGEKKTEFHVYELSGATDSVDVYLSDMLDDIRMVPLETDTSFLVDFTYLGAGGIWLCWLGD